MTQTMTREALPIPRPMEHNRYCILEYTPTQRSYLAASAAFPPVRLSQPFVAPVPGNPHALTIEVGVYQHPNGETTPQVETLEVPGVLVKSEEFVSGYFYGMIDAYHASQDGEKAVTEEDVIQEFSNLAADAVMLGNEQLPTAFSAGYLFGYMRGCTLIGTDAFQQWAEGECVTAS